MPVHCYGAPCDVAAIERIADTYNLKVVLRRCPYALASRTPMAACSGMGICRSSASMPPRCSTPSRWCHRLPGCQDQAAPRSLKNFGFVDEVTVVALGINGKMSEFNAALGLLQLQHIDAALERRAQVDARYRAALAGLSSVRCLGHGAATRPNHSYFQSLWGPDYCLGRDGLYQALKAQGIHARRYFYPLVSDFPMYRNLPSATANLPWRRAAQQIICLPIYPDL